ncbi:pyruvate, phosphate dikinase [Isoptericola sp. BMS4]|uniref:pyruvate, phosphate dikinase n=1 Tax=Isoptericola sp. BMS4 TaxID=2527875 RepID=UPI00141F672E|nr:pyruvate, phosphate dikinase [Isoptericola sp. BMS4]
MPRYVYRFDEGGKDQKDLLGGKGANLAEMTRLGLPVPPGFTISTDACREFMRTGRVPPSVRVEVTTALRDVEDALGRRLGDPDDPLLVSVRSGAKFSMPGMMDTVLNVGLTDATLPGLAAAAGDERFAWDSYRRLIQMFGTTVLGVDAGRFTAALEAAEAAAGAGTDVDLDTAALRDLVATFRDIVRDATGRDFPRDPREQLDLAIAAVFGSWDTERARLYRRRERIGHDLGTAVNVVAMVFGNLGDDSGTGVAFTRDPATGRPGAYGDYLPDAQGEDVVAGVRNTLTLDDLRERDPASHRALETAMRRLETHYRDLCDIEFTIERGRLWLLQTRVGKRTAAAAFRIAVALVDEGLITTDEALARVSGDQLSALLFGQFDPAAARALLTRGVGASPGAAVGEIALDDDRAVARADAGADVILVRRETTPDDLAGMIAATGILTARGGKTSHAAVVARGMGTCAVVGAEQVEIDTAAGQVRVGDRVLHPGDVISLDGATGEVFDGAVAVVDSPVARYVADGLDAGLDAAGDDAAIAELVRAVHRLLTHADSRRRLRVRANADTADDAARARARGAQGVGLCRTEHQFLGERRRHLERVVLATDDAERTAALDALLPLQRADFAALLEATDGQPTTIRLLDPPLHEFLPDLTDLSVRVALAAERGRPDPHDERLLAAVRRMHETNPMLGLRGVRLGLTVPGLFALQVRAVAEAALALRRAGRDPRPEIMVPLVGSARELHLVRAEVERVLAEVCGPERLDVPVGCMIELPRAALTAARVAGEADFFSFGTNDLTQTTWGFSRDDVEGAFFATYLDNGVLTVSPFETIDADGVGALVRAGVDGGRSVKPGLSCGVCGEHGGDPESIRFFHDVGLDYVSCSPFRVPVARLEAGRAAVLAPGGDADATA